MQRYGTVLGHRPGNGNMEPWLIDVEQTMPDNSFLRELSERIAQLLPAAENLGGEMRTKIEQTLQNALGELNVLTQEEFEAQSQSLQRAEQRITELETLVGELETRLKEVEGSL